MMSAASIPVQDRLDIVDLYARQSHVIDGGDGPGWADTFTPEGVFESPTFKLVATGRAALAEFGMTSNNAAVARGEQLRHWISAIVLTPIGVDTISSRAYLMILATSAQGTRIDRSLRIEDSLVRGESGWLFSHRAVFRDDATLSVIS
jgi:hypothetical protein